MEQSRKSKDQTTQWAKEKEQKEKQRSTKHYMYRKMKIKQHEHHQKPGVNSGGVQGVAVAAAHVAPAVLFLLQIW